VQLGLADLPARADEFTMNAGGVTGADFSPCLL
jgi:hypothetical protein